MAKKNQGKGPWRVLMRCTVEKEVYCENCTEEQAQDDPWEFAVDEQEISQDDWEVLSVKRAPE